MAKKFYAVKNGIKPGIYITWKECSENVKGFSGAVYKSFSTEVEAQEFLGINEKLKVNSTSNDCHTSEVVAYVDGSYKAETKQYSYGVVIFYNGKEEHLCEAFSDPEMSQMRNVAGEIEGAKKAMEYCVNNNIKTLDIFYDYEGIEKWCTGEWKANKQGTKTYKEYYDIISKNVMVRFIKVKGHSGNKYNDLADRLARHAVGIGDYKDVISYNENGIVANNISYDELNDIIELLKEDFNNLKVNQKEIPYGIEYKINIECNGHNERLVISHYQQKNKLCINGKKEELFNRLLSYIIELLEVDEIPDLLNEVHNLEIAHDTIEDEFNRYFPNSYNNLPSELNKYLHQAVYNLHIMGNMYMYNFLVEPAIRPLEGILKIALQDNDIPIRQQHKNYDSFFVFKQENDNYRLKDMYVKEKHSEEFLQYLSECYTYFNRHRHTLFHWDNPKAAIDTTRILDTVEEAHGIIKDSIILIDKYYRISE